MENRIMRIGSYLLRAGCFGFLGVLAVTFAGLWRGWAWPVESQLSSGSILMFVLSAGVGLIRLAPALATRDPWDIAAASAFWLGLFCEMLLPWRFPYILLGGVVAASFTLVESLGRRQAWPGTLLDGFFRGLLSRRNYESYFVAIYPEFDHDWRTASRSRRHWLCVFYLWVYARTFIGTVMARLVELAAKLVAK